MTVKMGVEITPRMTELPYTVMQAGYHAYVVRETATGKKSGHYTLEEAAHLANWLIDRHLGYPPR